ncbi:hypothetical protein OF83DRAFT_722876 [Amylostereum chailletii]|nr:hypothetical protein OF83DRAFT_722876 [Amylostereum chailletii]
MDDDDTLASTSYATLRAMPALDTASLSSSQPSSPRSSALPSPPDSPDSISSFPSLSSSFFFSSAAASPPHDAHSTEGLIIPSLTLPDALRQPTPYGKTLGDLRLIVLGDHASFLLEGNEDVVDKGSPESVVGVDGATLVRASTDWIEHRDAHGLERFEPAHNVEILEVSRSAEHDDFARTLLGIIHQPFHEMADIIDPLSPPSALLSTLVASSTSPLYTALIVLSAGLSTQERALIDTLGAHIPVIILPPSAGTHTRHRLPLSAFRPPTPLALQTALFRTPEALALLRAEAAERFFRWREIERAARSATVHVERSIMRMRRAWDKRGWEEDWDASVVWQRARGDTVSGTPSPSSRSGACVPLDPLHLPSLLAFSLGLFAPLKARIAQVSLSGRRLGWVLVGTLCAGIGIGLAARVL